MSTPIVYTFSASGAETVLASFRQIDAAADQSARKHKVASRRSVSAARKESASRKAASATAKSDINARLAMEAAASKKALAIERMTSAKRLSITKAAAKERERIARHELASHRRIARERLALERRANQKVAASRRQAVGGGLGTAGRFGGRMVRALGAGIGVTAAFGGAAVLGTGVRQNVSLRDLATRTAIMGHEPGQERLDPDQLRKSWRETAAAVPGTSATDVGKAVSAIVERTGELGIAQSLQKEMAKFAITTGSDLEDIGYAAAEMIRMFDIKTVEDYTKVMAAFHVQAKKGSFELKDAVKGVERIFGVFRAAGVKATPENARKLLGITQLAAQMAGKGAKPIVAMENLGTQLGKKASLIKKETGVDVLEEMKAGNLETLFPKIVAGMKGDVEKLMKLTQIRGFRAIAPLGAKYRDMIDAGKSQEEAYLELVKITNDAIAATGARKEADEDYALAQQSSGNRMAAAWEQFTAKVDGELTSAIVGLIEKLPMLVEAIGPVVDAFAYAAQAILGLVEAKVELTGTPQEKADLQKRKKDQLINREKIELERRKLRWREAESPEDRAHALALIQRSEQEIARYEDEKRQIDVQATATVKAEQKREQKFKEEWGGRDKPLEEGDKLPDWVMQDEIEKQRRRTSARGAGSAVELQNMDSIIAAIEAGAKEAAERAMAIQEAGAEKAAAISVAASKEAAKNLTGAKPPVTVNPDGP